VVEEKKPTEEEAESSEKKPAGKDGLIKMLVFVAIGLVLVGGVAVGTLFLLGGDGQGEEQMVEETETATEGEDTFDEGEVDDSMAWLVDEQSVLDQIKNNLAFLDYEPDMSVLEQEEEPAMTVEDSLEAVNWFEKENQALDTRRSKIETRQKELERLDRSVSQKLLTLEQAESNRVAQLARLYDSMDPRAVTKLMSNLDDATVVSILPRMKIKNASAVLQLFPSVRAARLSKQMITIAEK
jgi:flagellar motility protein MotE (MotC chaperone)